MMPYPRKMKTNVSVILLTAVALLMSTLLLKEGPFLRVAASPAPQPDGNARSNIQSSLKAAAAGGWQSFGGDGRNPLLVLAARQPNPHLPTPSHKRNIHSSVGAWAAGLSVCRPASPQCPRNAPSPPGCCTANSKVISNGKAELVRNYESSIDARKHASADQVNIAVEGEPHKSSNVHNTLPQPNPHLPTPSHQRNVHSSVEASLSMCPPAAPQCPGNAPSPPGCCKAKSEEEQQVKANGKGELMRSYESSIDAGKHASAHHINMAVEGDRFRDSVTAHTQSFKCTRKLIGS
jgi:hypothetical protein